MFEGIKNQSVTVNQATSANEGGCNGCTSYIDARGQIPHRVWVIDVRGSSFRVCDECRKVLIKQLGTL